MIAFNRILTSVLVFASAAVVLATNTDNSTLFEHAPVVLTCGADTPPLANMSTPDESQLLVDSATTMDFPTSMVVKVTWNVIYKDTSYGGGHLTIDEINSAIGALNTHFAGTGISFERAGVRYYKNAEWFNKADNNAGNALATEMKNLLHYGTTKDLNVYSVGFTTSTLGGFATFPWWYTDAPKLDGVVFKWNTTPGGKLANYNQGKILTHEVGHWAGLYHTFQGGCSESGGDFVSDTPAEASAASGCPVGRDSCSGGGADPIRNYMDYTYDTCKTNPFTPGQIERMKFAMAIYRSS